MNGHLDEPPKHMRLAMACGAVMMSVPFFYVSCTRSTDISDWSSAWSFIGGVLIGMFLVAAIFPQRVSVQFRVSMGNTHPFRWMLHPNVPIGALFVLASAKHANALPEWIAPYAWTCGVICAGCAAYLFARYMRRDGEL